MKGEPGKNSSQFYRDAQYCQRQQCSHPVKTQRRRQAKFSWLTTAAITSKTEVIIRTTTSPTKYLLRQHVLLYTAHYCCTRTRRHLPCVDMLVLLLPLGIRLRWIYLDLKKGYLAVEKCASCDQVQHKHQKPCGDELDHTTCHIFDISCVPNTERKYDKWVDVVSGSKAALVLSAATRSRCSIKLVFLVVVDHSNARDVLNLFRGMVSGEDVVPRQPVRIRTSMVSSSACTVFTLQQRVAFRVSVCPSHVLRTHELEPKTKKETGETAELHVRIGLQNFMNSSIAAKPVGADQESGTLPP